MKAATPMSKVDRMPQRKRREIPLIAIKAVRDVEMVELDLDCEEKAFADLVKFGKRIATARDYFELGFRACLLEGLERAEKKGRRKKTP